MFCALPATLLGLHIGVSLNLLSLLQFILGTLFKQPNHEALVEHVVNI